MNGVVLADLDQLGELLEVLLHVDVAHRVVAEHPEEAVDVEVDGRRLDAALVERLDHDAAGGQLLADGAVGEDHGPEPYAGRRPRRTSRSSPIDLTTASAWVVSVRVLTELLVECFEQAPRFT